MAREGSAAIKDSTAPHPDDPRKPASPTDIPKPGWKHTLKSAWAEFGKDQGTDLAAGLTYYSVLSIFPALLALVSLLGVFGQGEQTVDTILGMVRDLGQGDVADQLKGPIESMVGAGGAGVTLAIGIVAALWSASGYVGGFSRAMNRVYEVDEGRGMVTLRAQQLGLTAALVVMAGLVLMGLAVSGGVARAVGSVVGLGDDAVRMWGLAKWPVILLLVVVMVALLYYATPNVQQPKFRWVSVGAGVAIAIWVLASVAFGFYVSSFGNYNKTYGALGGVIVFLLWLYITNIALILGAEVDSELERSRQLLGGIPAERELQLPPRGTSASEKAAEKEAERVRAGRRLRLAAQGKTESDDPYAVREVDLEPLPSQVWFAQQKRRAAGLGAVTDRAAERAADELRAERERRDREVQRGLGVER